MVLYTNVNNLNKFKICHDDFLEYTKANFLKLNESKTQLLIISSKNSKFQKPTHIHLMGQDIEIQTKAKYLGVG